jgi:hypothetical protein
MTRQLRTFAACVVLSLVCVPFARAQESTPSTFGRALKLTVLDPTTYAAPILYFDSTVRDWNTSQVFFRNGFVERNPRFTVSGLPGDPPLSYGAGRAQITKDAFAVLGVSAVHNFSSQMITQALQTRYPEHRKLIAVIGWAERIGVSSWMSYQVAMPHYRQTQRNQQMIATLGLK